MKDATKLRLMSQLPKKSSLICFTTYLPLVASFRENDWEKNNVRVNLHKQLVNIELSADGKNIIQKNEAFQKLGRGHKSGSRTLLEDFLTNIDFDNFEGLGKTLFIKGYLNELSARTFLLEASELISGERMNDEQVNGILESWKSDKQA